LRQVARTFGDRMGMGTVDTVESARMTGRTVAADRQGLADCTADRGAVHIVTAAAGVVVGRIAGIGQRRRITVAVTATGPGRTGTNDGHQTGVVRRVGGMGHFPAALVTGCTVTANGKRLSRGAADPGAVDIVTAAAGVVNLRIAGIG